MTPQIPKALIKSINAALEQVPPFNSDFWSNDPGLTLANYQQKRAERIYEAVQAYESQGKKKLTLHTKESKFDYYFVYGYLSEHFLSPDTGKLNYHITFQIDLSDRDAIALWWENIYDNIEQHLIFDHHTQVAINSINYPD